jgi:hypothetical protein
MTWLRENAVALLALVVVTWLTVALLRALLVAYRRKDDRSSVGENAARAERIRQDLQRKAAARKSLPPVTSPPAPEPRARPWWRPWVPLDPFGGTRGRWWRWVRERLGARREGESGARNSGSQR